jgi:hypothetical protein
VDAVMQAFQAVVAPAPITQGVGGENCVVCHACQKLVGVYPKAVGLKSVSSTAPESNATRKTTYLAPSDRIT